MDRDLYGPELERVHLLANQQEPVWQIRKLLRIVIPTACFLITHAQLDLTISQIYSRSIDINDIISFYMNHIEHVCFTKYKAVDDGKKLPLRSLSSAPLIRMFHLLDIAGRKTLAEAVY
jgi:hypothetical protein